MKKLNKKGFTIVELVIVIAVIAILAGVLIPTFATVVEKANESKAMQQAKNAYELFLAEYAEKGQAIPNLCIESGEYHFHVENGTFKAEAVKNHPETTESNYTACKVKPTGDLNLTYNTSSTKFETETSAASGS